MDHTAVVVVVVATEGAEEDTVEEEEAVSFFAPGLLPLDCMVMLI
jgi:hypothetical protein